MQAQMRGLVIGVMEAEGGTLDVEGDEDVREQVARWSSFVGFQHSCQSRCHTQDKHTKSESRTGSGTATGREPGTGAHLPEMLAASLACLLQPPM